MSTKYETNTAPNTFLSSPQILFVSVFVAVVLGASLIEFNELLFPPKVTALNFWAILPLYFFALNAWFAILTWGRYAPYEENPLLRVSISCTFLGWVTLLALMYFASRLPDSFLSYMWGCVVLFIAMLLSYFFRYRATHIPQPIGLVVKFGLMTLTAATAYSIWAILFPPIPNAAAWTFVFVACAILVGYRLSLTMTHAWQPKSNDQQ